MCFFLEIFPLDQFAVIRETYHMDVIPGIGELDPKELARKIALVLPFTDWIQLDIADDTLVASRTFTDIVTLGNILKPLQTLGKHAEAHLLVADPVELVKLVSQAGFSRVIAQVECNDPREFLAEARSFEMEVGLGLFGVVPSQDFQVLPIARRAAVGGHNSETRVVIGPCLSASDFN